MKARFEGDTLEEIAGRYELTRERVRQIVEKSVKAVTEWNFIQNKTELFEEDYYKYLLLKYDVPRKASLEIGIPISAIIYTDIIKKKSNKVDLENAYDDREIPVQLLLKVRKYLNRNKINIEGVLVKRNRTDIEDFVLKNYCTEEISFEDFAKLYNYLLNSNNIQFSEKIFFTDEVENTRKNRLTESKNVLWNYGKLRYYDIEGNDYSELLDELCLESFNNIEISSQKLFNEHLSLMKKYDIHNYYELHNLLKKVIPAEKYPKLVFEKNPMMLFGEFDRLEAALEIIKDNSPVDGLTLSMLMEKEYGYDQSRVSWDELSRYYKNGVFEIENKVMSKENMDILSGLLTEPFYYIYEIKYVYSQAVKGADTEEINKFNLKTMGFNVYSNYVVRGCNSSEYFHKILTEGKVIDTANIRDRYTGVQMFYETLKKVKQNLEIIEFEEGEAIAIKQLEKFGVTKEDLKKFCDEVYEITLKSGFFTVKSLIVSGFESTLFELGFSDWFYSNVLLSDSRFSNGKLFGNLMFYNGDSTVSVKAFVSEYVDNKKIVDFVTLKNDFIEIYGLNVNSKSDINEKISDTEIYFDAVTERYYIDKEMYHIELESVEGEW